MERLGVEAIRRVVLSVMLGENLRTRTEPITRRRIAQLSGALVALFTRGYLVVSDFETCLSEMAIQQWHLARKSDKAAVWPAQWILGLTDKGFQNVVRSNREGLPAYVRDFEEAVREAAQHCREQIGDYRLSLRYHTPEGEQQVELDWLGITRLLTAIGAQTLAIRGSDKSIYGKLFERLVLGSFLSLLGYTRVDRRHNRKDHGVYWLSDSSGARESDATLLVTPGRLARFDIGFIGPGNPELSKDKLSRYERELELGLVTSSSTTFIVIDRLPRKGKTEEAANRIGAEIVQMSMQHWPRLLARMVGSRFGVVHDIEHVADTDMAGYIEARLAAIPIQDFLNGVSLADIPVAEEPAP